MVKILDGKKIAEEIKKEIRKDISVLKRKGINPDLTVILVGSDPASAIYVKNKEKVCQELGIVSKVYKLNKNANEEEILDLIKRLNKNEEVHGILVQLPLPKHIDDKKIIEAVDPKKDVDCFHPENVGRMVAGKGIFYPCTPMGILEILKRYEIKIAGEDCVIVGRSSIVGKPLAIMLINYHATVTVCHTKTKNLAEKCLGADILVSAVGKAGLITRDMVKPGAVVIDVGMNRDSQGKLVGDVDFENVSPIAGAITPVPGGVGPMTIAMLMINTVEAAKRLSQK